LRKSRFKNLPTDDFGIWSIKIISSGNHHLANCGSKYFSNASFVIFSPSLRTTQAIGRSCHLGSSLAITAASKTDGCAIKAFSKSTDEIHSPPLLIKSPVRSTILDRKSTRLNSSHVSISYAVFCLKKKNDK